MSYSRWSSSNWYAFDNINGKLSLWHGFIGTHPDLDYEYLRGHRDSGTLVDMLNVEFPGLDEYDKAEAIYIIGKALEDDE